MDCALLAEFNGDKPFCEEDKSSTDGLYKKGINE